MKITKTAPENKDFFNEHGASLGSYTLIGLIGQLLSGMSLAYAVYALILAQLLKQGFALWTAPLLAVAGVVALFIELANRVLARRAIKPFVVKGLFDDDPDLAGRHKILNNSYLVGLVAIAALSYFLSAVGSNYYAEDSTAGPTLIDVDSLKETYADQVAKLDRSYTQDSLTLAGPFDMRLQASRDRFVSDSLALRKEREKYRPCATAGKQWCKNKLAEYLAKIDRARIVMNDSIAVVSSLKGNALMATVKERNAKSERIDKEKTSALFLANQKNEDLLKENESDSSFKGLVFIILTIAGQTVFYLMIYLSLQVEAGSDIQYEVEPNEFWNLPSVIDELKVMIAWRTERGLRRLIRHVFGVPGEHETDIPYRSLFENTNGKKNTNTNGSTNTKLNGSTNTNTRKNGQKSSVPFTGHENEQELTKLKDLLRQYRKRLAKHIQRQVTLEKNGKDVGQRTLDAIENNREKVEQYTKLIEELQSN
ncbi:MAG: hypothetical protein R2824_15740 [Saprospiraceae bacterium]|nr:hypothetical protein [Lewinella sp.]